MEAQDNTAARPSPPSRPPEPQSPSTKSEAKDASFVAALEAVDAFLAAQEQLAAGLRDARHALSRAKYALASSGGGASLAALPLRRPPLPPVDGGDDGCNGEVRAERWVELVRGGGGDDDDAEAKESRFELRVGPAPRRLQQAGAACDDNGGGILAEPSATTTTTGEPYDDPRSPPAPCPESVARADAARLRWAGASGALPPPALREAQGRFADALAAAVRSASAARAALLKAERARAVEAG